MKRSSTSDKRESGEPSGESILRIVRGRRKLNEDNLELLERGKQHVNYEDGSPLVAAARRGDPGVVQILLGGNPSVRTLHRAFHALFGKSKTAPCQTLELVNLFLSIPGDKIDLNLHFDGHRHIFFSALEYRLINLDIVQRLLDAGADPSNRWTEGQLITELDKCGAPIQDEQEQEAIPLFAWALREDNYFLSAPVIHLLVQAGGQCSSILNAV